MWQIDRQKVIVSGTQERSVRIRIDTLAWGSADERSRLAAQRILEGLTIQHGRLGAIQTDLQFNVTQHRWMLNTGEGHHFETTTYDRADADEIDFTYWR